MDNSSELTNERIIYNEQKLRFYKAKEVKILKKTLKEKKSLQTKKMKAIAKKIRAFRKRDLKNLSIGKALSILKDREELIEKKKNSKKEKEAIDEEFTKKIEKISKMNIFEYLRHINGTDEEHSNDSDTNTTYDDIQENKIDDLEDLVKKNNEIKYKKIKI